MLLTTARRAGCMDDKLSKRVKEDGSASRERGRLSKVGWLAYTASFWRTACVPSQSATTNQSRFYSAKP